MSWGVLTTDDGSGLSRTEKRAVLYRLQGGRCAVCRKSLPEIDLVGDHDHDTGLLRGLLCRPCNVKEGQTAPRCGAVSAEFDAYRASPPAAALGWMWEDPDPPGVPEDVVIAYMQRREWAEPA